MNKKRIVFIVGPTASGKSAISLEMTAVFNAEIVSCDSMQVYRLMDIGTDKIPDSIRAKIPHHMIDICDPSDEYSAFEYRRDALASISEIHVRRKLPIVVGGSGLYIKALCDGLSPFPSSSKDIRARLNERVQKNGLQSLHEELLKRDPKRAGEIHGNDERRIIRALEICYQSDSKPSDIADQKISLADLGYSFDLIGLEWPREELYARVNERVDSMIAEGLVDEVRCIKSLLSDTTRQALGYKEIIEHIDGDRSLEEAIDEIKKNTRHLVKKQITWFRKETRIRWIEMNQTIAFNDSLRMVKEAISTALGR